MACYEVWNKNDLGQRKTTPLATHFTLDEGMRSAMKLSKGTHEHQSFDYNANDPFDVKPTMVRLPNMCGLVERADSGQSVIRGYGIDGVWKDAVAVCKRCASTGMDDKQWGCPCPSCKGASYKPKV